ncbi:winged helix-turn-helix domain-containing protein [Haloarcula sp. JP-L23]|uniref:winged helix-turn-helix domain-containing protein n=1 Tax=Haloarcula sp. JP-L23 TaxID=2716717 RepID=UPI00140EFDF0|nr:winged helix-turn-helix transcriptional regulator [Haloarcula sp. JP-L23]
MENDRLWTGDVNEAVVEEWKDETSPFERVKEVLLSTTSFQYAGTIAERARVSEPSARKHLRTLADSGFAATENTGQGTRFKRSSESIAMERIKELHTELTRDELITGIQSLKSQIQAYQDEYDVTNPDDLALELEPADDGWEIISQWQAIEENLDLAQAALSLYDFDPDRGSSDEAGSSDRSKGAFAEDIDGLSA